jgi:hypothetical protein
MRSFDGISFWWALIMMGALALFLGLRAVFGWIRVRGDARDDYDYKKGNGMVPDALSRDEYERIYRRVYGPRGPAHAAAGALAILVLTPLAMLGFEAFLNLIYNLSGQSRVIEPGYLVWQFFLFFGMIATWVGIGYAASRRYHQTAPGNLQYEIDQHLYGGSDIGDEF